MVKLNHINKTFKLVKGKGNMKSLFKREYSYVEALKDISFNIEAGETVGYIGPNGAGKSTTIKIMCGILLPDSGICIVNGMAPGKDRAKYVKNIGVVFGQRSQLHWDLPVIDTFDFLKEIYRVSDNQYKSNKNMLIESLNLEHILYTPVRQLSLGQRMKCEIAASLLHNPKILFLDEPTIGLDAVSKVEVRNFIKELNKTQNTTVILTTHDMADIEALTERIMLIGKGQLLFDGNIDTIKQKYTNSKILTIKSDDCAILQNTDNIKNNIISCNDSSISLKVDTNITTISNVISHISNYANIIDIDIQEETTDDIIFKMYKELKI